MDNKRKWDRSGEAPRCKERRDADPNQNTTGVGQHSGRRCPAVKSLDGGRGQSCVCGTRRMADKLQLDLEQPLDMRMSEFKNDPERMKDVNDFLDEVVEKAKLEAEQRQNKRKGRLDSFGLQNGGKKIGASINKAKTSARTFASKVITAICNCTNTFKTVVANRN